MTFLAPDSATSLAAFFEVFLVNDSNHSLIPDVEAFLAPDSVTSLPAFFEIFLVNDSNHSLIPDDEAFLVVDSATSFPAFIEPVSINSIIFFANLLSDFFNIASAASLSIYLVKPY